MCRKEFTVGYVKDSAFDFDSLQFESLQVLRRRRVYHQNLKPDNLSNNLIAALPLTSARLERLKPWISRELVAILFYSDDLVLQIILALLRTVGLPEIVVQLREYLHNHAEKFLEELQNYMRSSLDMKYYDLMVHYS
jgi:hypothetical protein